MATIDSVKWKPIMVTYVEYPENDIFGMLLAFSSLSPIFIVVAFVTLIYFRREMQTISYFVGVLGSEITNYLIKHFVKEPRPTTRNLDVGVKYGWPSSHAQFIWFFTTYLICFIYIRCHDSRSFQYNLWKHLVCVLSICLALTVSYSRVYLQYHTQHQVIWGSIIGLVLSLVWFFITEYLLTPLFPMFVHSKLGEFFMIRDSTLIPNVLWFEYSVSRRESRNRSRKSSMSKVQ